MRALVYVVPLALAIFALIDMARSGPLERAGLHPAAWAALIVLLPVIGPVLWLVVSRSRRSGGDAQRPGGPSGGYRPGRPGGPSGAPPRRRGPVAPDDDPEFLWRLEQEQRRAGHGDADPPADGNPEPPSR